MKGVGQVSVWLGERIDPEDFPIIGVCEGRTTPDSRQRSRPDPSYRDGCSPPGRRKRGAQEGNSMHVVTISLAVAFVVCVLLLVGFWLFTLTPFARRIVEQAEHRYTPRTH
jgi:hypothetical protein